MDNINNFRKAEIKDILDNKLAKCFSSCSWSFRSVENVYFKDFIETCLSIEPAKINYRLPTRQTLSKILVPRLHAELNIIKKRLLQNTESVLMVDGWKNKSKKRKFFVMTLRNINVDQAFLSFEDVTSQIEDGDNLSEHIVKAVKFARSEYQTHVCAITNDNEATVKAAARKASNKLKLDNFHDVDLLLSTCFSHSGNLLLQTIVDATFAEQLKEVVTVFNSSRNPGLLLDHGGYQMQCFPQTRWCYIVSTCECVWKNLKAMKTVSQLDASNVPGHIVEIISSVDFQRKLVDTIRLLTPICKLINASQDPRVNIADGTDLWLQLKLSSDDFDEDIEERKLKAIPDVAYAAYWMHHKYTGELLDDDQRQRALDFLTERLDDPGRNELDDFLINRETYDKAAENVESPIDYWTLKEFKYPVLSKLCLQLMLIPASTAQLEGFFSQWSYVENKWRNKLSNERTAQLADIYHFSKHVDTSGRWTKRLDSNKRSRLDIEDILQMGLSDDSELDVTDDGEDNGEDDGEYNI